jgi:hypothetical protein
LEIDYPNDSPRFGMGVTATIDSRIYVVGGNGTPNGWHYLSINEEGTIALSIPDLHTTAISPNRIQLSWNQDSGALGYRIQRKAGNCSSTNAWATRVDVAANISGFAKDTFLTPNTVYSYRVASYWGGNSFSPWSACASATTNMAGTPNMPSGMTWPFVEKTSAVSRSSTEVFLAWDDESTDENSFAIYRKAKGGEWTQIDSTEANSQSYTDTTATGNTDTTSYSYDVRGCNALGCSQANPDPLVVPFAPTGLVASIANSKVHLVWEDKSGNETNYQVFRNNGVCNATTPDTNIAAPLAANTKSYDDGSGVSGQTYSYKVRAVYVTSGLPSSVGYSKWSNCVTKTAP